MWFIMNDIGTSAKRLQNYQKPKFRTSRTKPGFCNANNLNMNKRGVVVLLMLLWSANLMAQPTFLYPSDGPEQEGLPPEFTISVSRIGFLTVYDIQLSRAIDFDAAQGYPDCLLYTSPSPRDA